MIAVPNGTALVLTTYRRVSPGQLCAVVSLRGGSVLPLIVCITTWNSLLRICVNTECVIYYEQPYYTQHDLKCPV